MKQTFVNGNRRASRSFFLLFLQFLEFLILTTRSNFEEFLFFIFIFSLSLYNLYLSFHLLWLYITCASVCDYCASTSPHTVCVTCDAILCMNCIIASKHSIMHPNHRCKTILQIGKDMTLIPQEKSSPSKNKKKKKKKEGNNEDDDDDDENEVVEYLPKVSWAHLKTLRHSLTQVVSAKDSMERVLGPAHDEWRLSGGERYQSLEEREILAAEKRRQKRALMAIYATPPEHNYAMWASGMQKHEEARQAIQQAIDAQEKRLSGDPPIVAPLAASYGIAASVEANAGERQGAIKCLSQSLTLMDPNNDENIYAKQFDRLAFYLATYGMIPLSEMLASGELEEQHKLLPIG